jgi:hypothetical protein
MSTTLQEAVAYPHLRIKQLSSSLLFQLLLKLWFSTHKDLTHIQITQESLLSAVTAPTSKRKDRRKLLALEKALMRLVGSVQEVPPPFVQADALGSLSRLRLYCHHFSGGDEQVDKDASKLHESITRALAATQQANQLLQAARMLVQKNRLPDVKKLYLALEKADMQMKRFSSLIPQIINSFSDDENVLFFIVRHSSELDDYYDCAFVFEALNTMFPKGADEACHFIIKKYKNRGFDKLLPIINEKIQEIIENSSGST